MTTTASGNPMGLIGRLGMTLFFGVFLAAGLFFFYLISKELVEISSTYRWKESPATIVSSSVAEGKGSDPFSVAVTFRYNWEGRTYTSDRFHTSSKSYSEYAKASAKIVGLQPGMATHCYVNPQDPGSAVLRREGFLIGLFLLLPLIFVAVGGGGVVAAWLPRSKRELPLSSRQRPRRQRAVTMLFGSIFALVGGALLVLWFIPTMVRSLASSKWTETPCTIISSRVKSHSDSDGTTYSVDVFYRYKVDGKEYKSNAYSLFGGSSSGYKSKAKVVANYPEGSQRVCYVNPENPGDAILKRGVGWEMLFGLLPLVFIAVGLAIFFSSFWKPAAPRGLPVTSLSSGMQSADALPLRSKATPVARLSGVFLFSLIWNGVVSVFLIDVIDGFRTGSADWFLTLFLVPFVLIGLGSILFVVYSFMALANPRCHLQVSPTVLRPGIDAEVTWSMSGAAIRLQRLRIVLEGHEEAVYRRGTSTCTDRSVFARIPVTDVSSTLEMAQGSARIRIPAGVPPSFASTNNKIIWTMKVHGEIPRWPDVLEDYEISMAGGAK